MRRTSYSSRRRSISGSSAGGLFDAEIVEESSGFCLLRVIGKGAADTFKDEAGGHRWQRIPPTERRGRVQTSTITVAILREPEAVQLAIAERDLEWSTCRSSGNGGQNVQKTDSAVQVKHIPTGTIVKCQIARSQHENRATALAVLSARLWDAKQRAVSGARADERKRQIGSGMRGDKRRTIRVQDGQVNDHETGRTWQFKDYARGNWQGG